MFKVIDLNDCPSNRWTGGQTKELFIYPPGSTYRERNFKFRLSIATTDVDESNFTNLPKIKRVLTILNGKLKLIFNREKEINLAPYEILHFSGEDEVKAFGKVKDFNLMLNGCKGDLNRKPFSKLEKHTFVFAYLISQEKFIITDEKSIEVDEKEDAIYGYILRDNIK